MIWKYVDVFVRIFQELIVEALNYAIHCEVTTFEDDPESATRKVFPVHNCTFWVSSLRTSHPFAQSVTPWELRWFPSLWTNGLGASDQNVEIDSTWNAHGDLWGVHEDR